jgi:hypothetical protein
LIDVTILLIAVIFAAVNIAITAASSKARLDAEQPDETTAAAK